MMIMMGVGTMAVEGITFDGYKVLCRGVGSSLIHERGCWALEMEV